MRFSRWLFILFILTSCSEPKNFNVGEYFAHIKQAELAISNEAFEEALKEYKMAFTKIEKPFGKDVFNAALASQLTNDHPSRDAYLQTIINNSNKLDFVKSVFVDRYMSEQEWENLIFKRAVKYDEELRREFEKMRAGDQLFRPMYETHDDTINFIRKKNMQRINELIHSQGFPSHIELGCSNHFWNQPHDIVLHHTAQRRSYDKSVIDLEPILKSAVESGRLDPEKAILYLNYQNDREKDYFEVYSSWQHKHPLLPDSLNNKVWYPRLDKEQEQMANETRKKWFANSIEEIEIKSKFLNGTDLPFVFTSVRKSVGLMRKDLDKESALQQYYARTQYEIEQE